MDGCVECVREAVCKHPFQTWVLKHVNHSCDFLLNDSGLEQAILRTWTLVLV